MDENNREPRTLSAPQPATDADDARFMALALALGRRGLGRTWPNPAVGVVIVRNDGAGPVIVGRGWTQPGGRPHGEIEALRRAGAAARGATLYATLEPCSHHGKTPPCADAIVAAGIARVVSALVDPNPEVAGAGHWRMAQAGIVVEVGLGDAEARRAHAGHIRRVQDGRPHVILKLAFSADGKAGLAGRRPAAITGEAVRERVHLMRAISDAVVTGIGTVLADDPMLTCRLPGMADRSPVRVVLDGKLRLPPASKLLTTARDAPLWVVTGEAAPREREQVLRERGAEVFRVGMAGGTLDLVAVLRLLAERGITRLLVEAGPILAAAFVRADLVDEAVLFRSATPIGGEGIDALDGLPLSALTQSARLKSLGSEAIGQDTVETFERA
jgi:diaminohydroxyphosphoribosylaminopyrimidine deaminase/5-amino-6-(5-phosphoribosylamino)uracil reductase